MNICIIPARAGSQRIPEKNSKMFCGKPMIQYPIEAVKESGIFDRIVVSTDDAKIIEIANELGVAYFTRGAEFAKPDSPMVEAVLEALDAQTEEYENVCMVYACNPFIKSHVLKEAFSAHDYHSADVTTAVYRSAEHAEYSLIMQNGKMTHRHPEHKDTNSQAFPETYQSAGQFYFAGVKHLQLSRTFAPQNLYGVVVDSAIDIDTPQDWAKAEAMYILENHPGLLKWSIDNVQVISECSAMGRQHGCLHIHYSDGHITHIDRSITVRNKVKEVPSYDG